MRILLSAYACEPGQGSEPGVGWHWAMEMVALKHEVWVLTRGNNRQKIESVLHGTPVPGLHFEYFDLSPAALRIKRLPLGIQWYYPAWQQGIGPLLHELHARFKFDAAQHLTFGVFRTPGRLCELGIPWVFGPVGGGEFAPHRLRGIYPWRGRLADMARDVLNALAPLKPSFRRCLQRATLILAKTPQTLARLPRSCLSQARCQLEIGIGAGGGTDAMHKRLRNDSPVIKLLFVGRFLYWKGGALAIEALAGAVRAGCNASLTFVGKGPERRAWQRRARSLGVADRIEWIEWVSREALSALYEAHDAFLFPSLHDSSGNVVLEALAHGLPVICLDIGGPAQVVDAGCAITVPAANAALDEVIARLGQAVAVLAGDRPRLQGMRRLALERAAALSWHATVAAVWSPEALQQWIGPAALRKPAAAHSAN